MKTIIIVALILGTLFTAPAWPQASSSSTDSFVIAWFQRSSRAESEQPHWAAPLFTVTPRLVQQFRYDVNRQLNNGSTTANYGGGKGLELVPINRVELSVSAPPYLTHTKPGVSDGVGDMAFLVKYRIAAANPEHGNFIVTAMLAATMPTGAYANGSTDASMTPTLALGKGWGNFDLQGTAGVTVPTGDRNLLGTPVVLNATAQYHLLKYFWSEVEVNSTIWANGKNEARNRYSCLLGWLQASFMYGSASGWRLAEVCRLLRLNFTPTSTTV